MKKTELRRRLMAMGMATVLVLGNTGLIVHADEPANDTVATQEAGEPGGEGIVTIPDELPPVVNSVENAVNLETSNTELYVGSDWAGCGASIRESGTVATFDVSSFGWNGQWGLQYIVKNLNLQDHTTYRVEFDITSDVDKKFFLKLDDVAGFIAEEVQITGGQTLHYSKTVSCGQFCAEKPYLFFALGQMSGEDANRSGRVVLENLVLTEVVDTGESGVGTATGAEYDFTADNSAGDYADPGAVKEGYTLIWADEFDGNYGTANVDGNTGLNLDNWAYQLGDGSTDCGNYGWGNNELQAYTDRLRNLGVNEDLNGDGGGEGVLRITASREDGYLYANESAKNYTSARIRTTTPTEALFNTTYGYVEARIALPATAGAWPAFWMLPQSTSVYGGWPVSGEIDILETCGAFGDGKGSNLACGTLHWGTPTHVYKGSGYVTLNSDYTYFHTYAIDWEPGKITWYYDGEPINTLSNWESKIPGASDSLAFDAPFDMPFYMILNLAVDSGQFGGAANRAGFTGDINMYVDYVRVFQKTEGYAADVVRQAGEGTSDNWADFAGINQIAELTAASLNGQGGGLNDSASDASMWYLSNQDDAPGATLGAYTDHAGTEWARVGVNTAGGQDYSVQLIGHYNARNGYVYKVSFDAYAEGGMVGKEVNCDSKEWQGWSTYGVTPFTLSANPEHYSFTFQQEEDFDNCRIEFNLGARSTGNVYLSNVKVEIVDPATIGSSESARTPMANGNLIYNGSFDQGAHKLKYWAATDSTIVDLPRYTTVALTGSDKMVVDKASMLGYEQIMDGRKYYERRAQISAPAETSPVIYQPGLNLVADTLTVEFDLYSAADTVVKAAVYSAGEAEGRTVPVTELGAATARYSAADGVRHYVLQFETRSDASDAALVLIFGKGASVQLDNVSMKGANQATGVNEHPLTTDSSYRGDNGGGGEIALIKNDGTVTMQNIASGGNWYSPQLASGDFELVAGQNYKLSFDYKLEGPSNNTFQYIIQENNGSWHVYDGGPTTVTYDSASADADGFNHYERVFTADATISNVHLNYGFGGSAGVGTLAFTFRNAVIDLVRVEAGGSGQTDNEAVADEEFAAELLGETPGGSPQPGNSDAEVPGDDNTPGETPVEVPAEQPGQTPVEEQPPVEEQSPVEEQPPVEQPSVEETTPVEQPSVEEPAPAEETTPVEQPAEETPVAETPAEENHEDQQVPVETPDEETREEEQVPVEEQTPVEQPAEQQPVAEVPAENNVPADNSSDNNAAPANNDAPINNNPGSSAPTVTNNASNSLQAAEAPVAQTPARRPSGSRGATTAATTRTQETETPVENTVEEETPVPEAEETETPEEPVSEETVNVEASTEPENGTDVSDIDNEGIPGADGLGGAEADAELNATETGSVPLTIILIAALGVTGAGAGVFGITRFFKTMK